MLPLGHRGSNNFSLYQCSLFETKSSILSLIAISPSNNLILISPVYLIVILFTLTWPGFVQLSAYKSSASAGTSDIGWSPFANVIPSYQDKYTKTRSVKNVGPKEAYSTILLKIMYYYF